MRGDWCSRRKLSLIRGPQKTPEMRRIISEAESHPLKFKPRDNSPLTTTSPCTWATICHAESRAKSLCPVTMLQEDGE
jgi:hypothetical protein